MSTATVHRNRPSYSRTPSVLESVLVAWHDVAWHSKVRIGVLTVALFMALC